MEQELLILGDVDITFKEEVRGIIVVRISGEVYLGTLQRSYEGYWRFISENSMYDSFALSKIAKKLQEMNDADRGLTGRIHQ